LSDESEIIDDLDVLESPKSELIHENSNNSSTIHMGVESPSANISVDAPFFDIEDKVEKCDKETISEYSEFLCMFMMALRRVFTELYEIDLDITSSGKRNILLEKCKNYSMINTSNCLIWEYMLRINSSEYWVVVRISTMDLSPELGYCLDTAKFAIKLMNILAHTFPKMRKMV